MARLGATTSSNFTDSDKGVINTTAAWVIDSEASTLTISTSTSTHISPSATPGAIDIDGVYLKLSSRVASPSGTFTVVLRNTTAGSDVTSVVVNVTDLKVSGGWHFFKFGATETLLAATNYAIRVTCSVASEVILFRSTASSQEFCRLIRTTTTAAPAAGDQLIIANEYLSAGSSNDLTLTMNNTASTVFGATTYVDSIAVSGGATLTWGTTGSTNYLLTVAGVVSVWSGSTWNQGTSGTRMPSTSTARLVFSVATNVDSGFIAKAGSTVNRYGAIVTADNTLMTSSIGGFVTTVGVNVTRVSGQSFTGMTGTIIINGVSYTISVVQNPSLINLTGSAGTQSTPVRFTHPGTANVLTVGSTTDWAVNDVIAVASTSQTAANCESATILTVDSSTQVTLTAALSNQHSGDSPTQAEVIHLTRNVRVEGISTSLQAYVTNQTTAVVNESYCEFKFLGSATTNKRGIEVQTTTGGSYTAIGCTCHSSAVSSSCGWFIGTSANNISITYCHVYNITSVAFSFTNATGNTNVTIDHCIAIKNTSGNLFTIGDIGCTCTNLTAVGGTSTGISIVEGSVSCTGTISNLTAHSCANTGISISQILGGNAISNVTVWRCSSTGVSLGGSPIIDGLTVFGCISFNITSSGASNLIINNLVSSGDIVFSTNWGWNVSGAPIYVTNSTFSVLSGIKTAHTTGDLVVSSNPSATVFLRNCILAASTELAQQSNAMALGSRITSQRHDQTNGLHKRWERAGIAVIDTVTYRTASPAETLTPNNTTWKFASADTQPIAIDNGQTATVSVYVYKSASYNGAQPRLILRQNDAIGITSDTVLATASGGTATWLLLSGTTPAVTDDGAIVCYVDCDGTVGTVTVDDWSVA